MADQQQGAPGNGADNGSFQPQVSILAQYVKDLSFENPSAPEVYSVAGPAAASTSSSTSNVARPPARKSMRSR